MKRMVLLAALAAATVAPAGWWRTYGGEGYDAGYCIQVTENDNYIICGYKFSESWLIKLDTSGNIIWQNFYNGTGTGGRWVEETSMGEFIVTGMPDLLKTTSIGDSMWAYDYGIWSQCVDITTDGGYILTGSYGYGDSLALIRTDVNGIEQWSKGYLIAGWNLARGFFVRQTTDGGYIIAGEVGYVTNVLASQPFDSSSPLILKTDSLGNKEWQIVGRNGEATCVRQTDDSGYIVTGTFGLLRLDSLGDTLWFQPYGGYSVQQTADNGFIVTGSKDIPSRMDDLWLLKTNSSGDSLWSRTYGGRMSDAGYCVQQTNDRGYIIVGETWSFGAGEGDIYLLKTDSLGLLGIKEGPVNESEKTRELICSIGQEIRLAYSDRPQGFHAYIYDAMGCRVGEIHSSATSGTIVWGDGYNAGVYFICAPNKLNQTSTAKVVLVR